MNTAKTKLIVFRTRGQIINPLDCPLVYNVNEIGQPEDPSLIFNIERIHNDGDTKSFKLLGAYLMNTFRLMNISTTCVQKFPSHFSV